MSTFLMFVSTTVTRFFLVASILLFVLLVFLFVFILVLFILVLLIFILVFPVLPHVSWRLGWVELV